MKGLAIRQPWTWAVMKGLKPVENRNWGPSYPSRRFAETFRGRFVVHASANSLSQAKWNEEWEAYCLTAIRAWDVGDYTWHQHEMLPSVQEDLIFGHLLGTVELVDVVLDHPSPWFFGPIGLVLRDPRPFKHPIPFTGAQGFFDVPDELLRHEIPEIPAGGLPVNMEHDA